MDLKENNRSDAQRLLRLFTWVYGPIALLIVFIFLFVLYERSHMDNVRSEVETQKGAPVAPEHPASLR